MRSRMRKGSKRIAVVASEQQLTKKDKVQNTLITRRGLFQGTGAVALTYSVSNAAYADSAPHVDYDGDSSDTIWIRYLGRSWRLHNRDFGPATTLTLSGTAPDWKVVVEGSVYPGTKLSANGQIRIFKRDDVWCVGFDFKAFGLEDGLLLADWMSDAHQPKAIVKNKRALADRFPHKSVSIAATTAVGFARASDTGSNVFFLEDETQAIVVARAGLRANVGRFEVAVEYPLQAISGAAAGGAGPLPPILFDRLPQVDCTVLLLERMTVLAGGAAFAVSSSGTSFRLADVAISGGRVRYFDGGGANTLAAVEFQFAGTLAAEASPKESGAVWPRLPLDPGRYHMVDDGKSIEISIMGRLPDKAFLTTSGHVRLILSGVEEHELLRARTIDGQSEIKNFSVSAKLYSAFVPMHAADYSRFDFRDTRLDFVLDELVNPSKLDPERSVFVLGNVPVFGAVLHDNATLSVHRAADLLDLKYGFRNLYLRSTPEQATIEKCATTIGGVTLPAATPAMMIVHFPPQHIAEKAFLRVSTGVKVGQSDIPAEEARSLTPEQTAKLIQQRRGKVVPIGEHRAYETGGTVKLPTAVQAPGANHDKNLVEAKGVRDADFSNYITKKFANIDVLEALDRVVEARAAGPTRIAFEIPEPAEPAPGDEAEPSPILPMNFSLDTLTNWTRLKTKVSARALPPSATPLEQLALARITPATPMDGTNGKLWSIRRSLFQHGAPAADETSIEFPYRLQLSPSNEARWSTPPRPDAAAIERGVPPFYAHLDSERGGRSVRAIWSTDFDESFGAFLHDDSDKRRHPPHSNNAPWLPPEKAGLPLWLCKYLRKPHRYRMSLDRRDRHELVLLSSVYGLPALLPMPTISTDENGKHNDPGKPADPYVVPLPEGFTPAHNQYLGGEGLYVPRPLSRSEITLSALGATVDLEGQWDPPSGYTLENKDTPLWPALTVERWKHRAFQGRDMFVEIVYKGFIFPFGHRCSVVKATERSFYPDPRSPEDHSATVAYLTQRFFVLIGEPEKRYPAVGQPFAGRAMPYAGVRILTTKSPAIMDPFENWIGEGILKRAGAIGAYAFFPKIAGGKDVEFEFEVTYPDGRASKRLAAPLIVADNTLAHDPQAVQELIAFYNSLEMEEPSQASYGRRHRQVSAFDQKLKYAAERDGGDTEFRTRRWLLGAHAREIEDPADNGKRRLLPFMMDAVMEGADQPPFYPAIETAEVEIQSLNAMNGVTEGFTEVGHDLHFLRYGFAPGRNDAEVYLAVRKPNFLKLENRANASGGIATPNNRVLSISRLKGPVGGGSDSPPPSTNLTLLRTKDFEVRRKNGGPAPTILMMPVEADPGSGSPSFTYELPASHQNKFDPLEFFGKALSQAKLFGIIPMKDVVRAISFVDGAPEMIERTVYALLDAGDKLKEKVSFIASSIRDAINEAITAFESKLSELGSKVGVTLTKEDIYPELTAALRGLAAALDAFEASAQGFDPAKPETEEPIVAAISHVVAAANRALTETRKVIRKPAPAIVEQTIAELQQAAGAIKSGLENTKGLGKIVADYFAEQILEQIKAELSTLLSGLLLTQICDDDALFPLAVLALTGYPDTKYEKTDGPPKPVGGRICVTFDITNPDHRRRAQEAILYEMVGKPLIDGYMALDTLVAKIRDNAVDVDTAFKELPGEIVSIVEKWLDGILKLEQYAAMGNKLLEGVSATLWEDVVSPALRNYVVPLIHPAVKNSDDIRKKGEETGKRISGIYGELIKVIQSGKTGQFKPQLEQAASTIAKMQKALTAVLEQHDEARTLLGKYFDLSTTPDSEDYVKPLKVFYDAGRIDVVAQLNGLVGRLFVEKDALFRRSRDVMTASVEALDLLGRVDQLLEGAGATKLGFTAPMANDLKTEVRTILLEVARLVADVGMLIKAAGEINDGQIDKNHPLLNKIASVKVSYQNIKVACDRIGEVGSKYQAIGTEADKFLKEINRIKIDEIDSSVLLKLKKGASGLATSTDSVIASVFGQERLLAGAISQATSLLKQSQAKVEEAVYGAVTRLLTPMVELLIAVDQLALKIHGRLKALIDKPADKLEILKLFLSQELTDLLADTNGKIENALTGANGELTLLANVKAGLSGGIQNKRDASDKLWTIIDGWRRDGGRPVAIRVFEPLAKTIEILLTGKLGDLVDFSRVETAIADALFSFIPKEIAFDYDWGTKLDPFPSENTKLFWIDATRDRSPPPQKTMLAKHFETKKQNPVLHTSDDLVIVAKAGVRLDRDEDGSGFTPKPFFAVESQIINPSINLFGNSFDVVTIQFDHLRFIADENGTDFDAKIRSGIEGVQFGKAVDYITKLASLFPKYVPPWLELMFSPPGVALKFGFPAFSVSIGTMAISNLAVGIRIEIPFDNRPLLGRLSLSERNKPFLVSFAPYGGGGYLALRTQATSIVGFELQLEFGAVVIFAFGPLNGFGMVSAGIYIEKVKGQDLVIAGFVRALGEGSLGCFSIAVQIEVRVTQKGSDVTGEATFSYSFKVGFAKFRFSFTAAYAFAGGGGGGGGGGNGQQRQVETFVDSGAMKVLADNSRPKTAMQHLECEVPALDKNNKRPLKTLVQVKNRFDDWKTYSEYFG